jgi:glycosyltransferase involved in cell wall biosynthesis
MALPIMKNPEIEKKSTSLISVVIPCFRDSTTLARAIESVYAQTMPINELIVVNDCSPESKEIELVLQAYKNVVYIKNPVNIGLAATRNKGISIATGDIVCFLDADDELHPQKIEMQYTYVGVNSVVACNIDRVINGESGRPWMYFKSVDAKQFQGGKRLIYRNTITAGASLMAHKSLLLKMNGYAEDLHSCEDFDLWLRLINENVNIFYIKQPLYRYYFNKNGLSKNILEISKWEIQTLLKHFRREGVVLSESTWAARVWSFWVLKHIARFEACKDERLSSFIDVNLNELANFPGLFNILWLIKTSRVLKIFAWLTYAKQHLIR